VISLTFPAGRKNLATQHTKLHHGNKDGSKSFEEGSAVGFEVKLPQISDLVKRIV
jgi:hypothetical protein